MRQIFLVLLIALCFPALAEESWEKEAQSYIEQHPETSKEIKNAILAGKVILGMCPNEAIAAAGRPGPYKIIKDKKWASEVPPPIVAIKQCEEPDNSIIEFLFRNDRQFEASMHVFHVRFEKGKAVVIDQNGF
jgi:hypothetical protein